MALQLCCNILSGADRTLPFGCKINMVDSPYPILKEFINTVYNNVLHGNYHEFTFFEKGDPGFVDDFEVDVTEITINVWRIALPWSDEFENLNN